MHMQFIQHHKQIWYLLKLILKIPEDLQHLLLRSIQISFRQRRSNCQELLEEILSHCINKVILGRKVIVQGRAIDPHSRGYIPYTQSLEPTFTQEAIGSQNQFL